MKNKRYFIKGLILTLVTVFLVSPFDLLLAKEAKFPSKPIEIILPAAAGGSLDRETRLITPFIEKHLGVPITIEYVAGAAGIVAYNKFYREKADGYTILTLNFLSAIQLELTRETAKYVVKNLPPIAAWSFKNFALLTHSDNWKTLSEFLNEAKKKKISMTVTGGTGDLQSRLLEDALGIKFNWVPFDSAAEGLAAVAGKHVDAVLIFSLSSRPLVQAGKLRGLAVLSPKRDPILPEVPTSMELGHDEIPCLLVYGGFMAPPNTPKEILTTLEEAISKAIADPEFVKLAKDSGIVVDFLPSSQVKELIGEHYKVVDRYKKVIK